VPIKPTSEVCDQSAASYGKKPSDVYIFLYESADTWAQNIEHRGSAESAFKFIVSWEW
jgi:predicted metalloprotease with PDZ domain